MTVANVFPLKHIVEAFDACFVPGTPNDGWSSGDLAVIAIWGIAGLRVAVRRFRWEPGAGDRARCARRSRAGRRPRRGAGAHTVPVANVNPAGRSPLAP